GDPLRPQKSSAPPTLSASCEVVPFPKPVRVGVFPQVVKRWAKLGRPSGAVTPKRGAELKELTASLNSLRKNSSRRKKHTSGAEAQTHFQRLNGTSKEGAEKLTWFLAKGALEAGMRGNEDRQEEVFSYIPLEKRVGAEHPLRRLRAMADRALSELGAWFDRLYSQTGRPSIPPEQLLRALILQALYTI